MASFELVGGLFLENKSSNIESIVDMSDEITKRMRVEFKNGHQLSIIYGLCTYGVDSGLFEIAIFDKVGEFDGSLFDEEDKGDDVLGYCDKEKVEHYVNKIGNLI